MASSDPDSAVSSSLSSISPTLFVATLSLRRVTKEHIGNYSCSPSNAKAARVRLHVIDGKKVNAHTMCSVRTVPRFCYMIPRGSCHAFLQSGAAGCEKGFVKCFLKVLLACRGSMAAAVQPNVLWNSYKTFYKTFFTICRPRLYNAAVASDHNPAELSRKLQTIGTGPDGALCIFEKIRKICP